MKLDIVKIQDICKCYPDIKRIYTAVKNDTSEMILICDSSVATAQIVENELKHQLHLKFKAVITLSEIAGNCRKSYQVIDKLAHLGYSGVKLVYSNKML